MREIIKNIENMYETLDKWVKTKQKKDQDREILTG